MSYIPKYILKRMFSKDAVKKVEGGVTITLTNVISPLSVDEVPEDVENYIELSVDGKKLDDEKKKQFKIILEDGTEYNIDNAQEFAGKVIPVGSKVSVFAPLNVNAGEEHEFGVLIKTDNPFELSVKREVV